MKKVTFIVLLTLQGYGLVNAQSLKDGVISGSFETNSIYYLTDKKISAVAPDDKVGSNSYLKLDYRLGNFSAGMQYEAYLPPLVGYPSLLEGNKVMYRYASYSNDLLSFTAGNFYEQFGSGLVFRGYEERALGINNALDGVLLKLRPTNCFQLKAFWGKQRKYLDNGEGTLRGADAEFDVVKFLKGESELSLLLGGSWVGKYQPYTGPATNFPTTVNSIAGRLQLEYGVYNLYSEYVGKEKDPLFSNQYSKKSGNAMLIQQSVTGKGLGVTLSLRRLDNIDARSERESQGSVTVINYIPSLTRQHKFTLANLHPYAAQLNGEIGGQLDVAYRFSKGSLLGGDNGMKVAFNYSQYNKLKRKSGETAEVFTVGDTLLFRDFSVEVEKKFSSSVKATFSYINQNYNKGAVEGGTKNIKAHIGVADLLFKFQESLWLKVELNKLIAEVDENDWSYAMAEVTFAPKWSIYISDMIDEQDLPLHYYSGGASYTQGATRIGVSIGRSREGLQCAGGLCLYVPAYSGFNLSVATTF